MYLAKMKSYAYKCIPILVKVATEEEFLSNTAAAYESVLNNAAKDGWQFVKIDTLAESQEDNLQNSNVSALEKICTKVFIFRKQLDSNNERKLNSDLNERTCPSCDSLISDEDIFCENCAFKLK